jgi:DNA-binding XRE family transcriptional regulator
MTERPSTTAEALGALDSLVAERGGLSAAEQRAFNEALPLLALGWQIRAARAAKGLTQAQVADLAGLSQPRIAEIERGSVNATWRTITSVCSVLEIDALKIPPRAA